MANGYYLSAIGMGLCREALANSQWPIAISLFAPFGAKHLYSFRAQPQRRKVNEQEEKPE
jgi:hypothetical protein